MLKKGYYSSMLHEPVADELFRGMVIDEAQMKSMGGDLTKGYGDIKKSFKFSPRNNYSSWTVDILSSKEFSYPDSEGQFGIIMVADSSANSGNLIDMQPFYETSEPEFRFVKGEKEVMAIGTVNVKRILYTSRKANLKYDDILIALYNEEPLKVTEV